MPACIWDMLVCVVGPLDTGQFLTYLYILLLLVIILNLIYLTYPTKIVAKVITKKRHFAPVRNCLWRIWTVRLQYIKQ